MLLLKPDTADVWLELDNVIVPTDLDTIMYPEREQSDALSGQGDDHEQDQLYL